MQQTDKNDAYRVVSFVSNGTTADSALSQGTADPPDVLQAESLRLTLTKVRGEHRACVH